MDFACTNANTDGLDSAIALSKDKQHGNKTSSLDKFPERKIGVKRAVDLRKIERNGLICKMNPRYNFVERNFVEFNRPVDDGCHGYNDSCMEEDSAAGDSDFEGVSFTKSSPFIVFYLLIWLKGGLISQYYW